MYKLFSLAVVLLLMIVLVSCIAKKDGAAAHASGPVFTGSPIIVLNQ